MKFPSLLVLVSLCLSASASEGVDSQNCAACHISAAPTPADAGLRHCPRNETPPPPPEKGQAPDVFLLGELSDIYVPVVFPHKLHAEMPGMEDGCALCHHQNPPGRILSCRECHDRNSNQENLRQPGLRGAYHRQCLGCHREWTHQTDCVVCHAKRAPGKTVTVPIDSSDIMGTLHPNIEAPKSKVYQVKDEMLAETPYVTFHHDEHVQLFGLKCVTCHREESCSSCHDEQKRQPHVKADPHQDCMQCHQEQIEGDCAMCHEAAPTKGFDHAVRSSFVLKSFHASLRCVQCHAEAPETYAGLQQDCAACHAPEWMPEKFDHAMTGQALDELHAMASCTDCHADGLGKAPRCDSCHDDGRTQFPPPDEQQS